MATVSWGTFEGTQWVYSTGYYDRSYCVSISCRIPSKVLWQWDVPSQSEENWMSRKQYLDKIEFFYSRVAKYSFILFCIVDIAQNKKKQFNQDRERAREWLRQRKTQTNKDGPAKK